MYKSSVTVEKGRGQDAVFCALVGIYSKGLICFSHVLSCRVNYQVRKEYRGNHSDQSFVSLVQSDFHTFVIPGTGAFKPISLGDR